MADVQKIIDTTTVPLVINFWASWCGPCVAELPYFNKIIPDYKNQNVRLILVSLDYPDDYPNGILAFAKKKKINAPLMWLDETDPNVFCPQIDKKWGGNIPVTLMINKKKKIRWFYDSSIEEKELKWILNKLIE